MSTTKTAVYVAFGNRAKIEAKLSIETLKQHNKRLNVIMLDREFEGDSVVGSRYLKTHLLKQISKRFKQIVYIDADTRINGNIMSGFDMLNDGWDIVLRASDHQQNDVFWHIDKNERNYTFRSTGYIPTQFQAGVMFINRNDRTERFFDWWAGEWALFCGQDQAAFVRALHMSRLKIWLLGKPWNGGALINHRYGVLR
jgi:lipopolysaccharide biosynthesis glycosyltransferase